MFELNLTGKMQFRAYLRFPGLRNRSRKNRFLKKNWVFFLAEEHSELIHWKESNPGHISWQDGCLSLFHKYPEHNSWQKSNPEHFSWQESNPEHISWQESNPENISWQGSNPENISGRWVILSTFLGRMVFWAYPEHICWQENTLSLFHEYLGAKLLAGEYPELISWVSWSKVVGRRIPWAYFMSIAKLLAGE